MINSGDAAKKQIYIFSDVTYLKHMVTHDSGVPLPLLSEVVLHVDLERLIRQRLAALPLRQQMAH